MNSQVYRIPHAPRAPSFVSIESIESIEMSPIAFENYTITDVERAQLMLTHGYLPKWLQSFHHEHATALLDWAFSQHLGPGYWREPKTVEEYANTDFAHRHRTAFLIFGGFCDRKRLDGLIIEAKFGIKL